mmetsp:Transcript_11757/g.36526  ORF Transcript_11757/g.36526 Transcript_11757/m.36526 type:complete len:255 (-) Transcript_11757:42-806(-)
MALVSSGPATCSSGAGRPRRAGPLGPPALPAAGALAPPGAETSGLRAWLSRPASLGRPSEVRAGLRSSGSCRASDPIEKPENRPISTLNRGCTWLLPPTTGVSASRSSSRPLLRLRIACSGTDLHTRWCALPVMFSTFSDTVYSSLGAASPAAAPADDEAAGDGAPDAAAMAAEVDAPRRGVLAGLVVDACRRRLLSSALSSLIASRACSSSTTSWSLESRWSSSTSTDLRITGCQNDEQKNTVRWHQRSRRNA